MIWVSKDPATFIDFALQYMRPKFYTKDHEGML
jgi:hypothetical protein